MNKISKKIGQASIPVAVALAGIAGLASYYGGLRNTDNAIAEVKQEVVIIKTKAEGVTSEVEEQKTDLKDMGKDLQRLEKKVDTLLIRQGVNPETIL